MELNKKLALWAGFKVQVEHSCGTLYESPEGGFYMQKDLPNFTEDLTACFKWLKPKLLEKNIMFYLSVRKTTIVRMYSKPYEVLSVGCDENSALAFCLAVEKLI